MRPPSAHAVIPLPFGRRFTGRSLALLAALAASPALLPAQRRTVTTTDVWIGTTGDLRLSRRALLTFTAEERRAEGVSLPRQKFGLVGLLADLGHGLRLGAGGSLWHTSPNAAFGPARPTQERRIFQQFSGGHRLGNVGVNHRFRHEHRWISAEPAAGVERTWRYTSRAREQVRLVVPIDGRAPAATSLYLMPHLEFFVPTDVIRDVLIDQTRMGAAIGVGAGARLNVEAGWFRQSLVRADRVHQVHGVFQVTGRVLTAPRAR